MNHVSSHQAALSKNIIIYDFLPRSRNILVIKCYLSESISLKINDLCKTPNSASLKCHWHGVCFCCVGEKDKNTECVGAGASCSRLLGNECGVNGVKVSAMFQNIQRMHLLAFSLMCVHIIFIEFKNLCKANQLSVKVLRTNVPISCGETVFSSRRLLRILCSAKLRWHLHIAQLAAGQRGHFVNPCHGPPR